jgi:hypothetical protein
VLYLFVLSHGESGGKILTDHFKMKASGEKNSFVFSLETYNTSDIWDSLGGLQFLSGCTKLLFFAVSMHANKNFITPFQMFQSCRGTNPEMKLSQECAADVLCPGWLTSKPNRQDFVVFYATVESMCLFLRSDITFIGVWIRVVTYANRNELHGTWFVQSICNVLDQMTDTVDILIFYTRVQNQLCRRGKNAGVVSNIGQTPQLHYFSIKELVVCQRHTQDAVYVTTCASLLFLSNKD